MIIHSLRLKNIKSYGEGPDGNGLTIQFRAGVNCIAGQNGYGKTTLIEALGYALFLTAPPFEERFNLATYFLRSGKSAGEIDVTFECGGQVYRLERGLGTQNRRRSKVVQLSDGSTCALDDAEVSAFLCRLLGLGAPARLGELFSKLLGVKQGQLTWPFDSKPAAAKEFFEPLLDVAIFRESSTRLSETQARFQELLGEQEKNLAVVEERLRERVDSRGLVEAAQQAVASGAGLVQKLIQEKAAADKQQEAQAAKQRAVDEAQKALETSKAAWAMAVQKRETDSRRLQEAEEASHRAAAARPAFEAYTTAETALRELQRKESEKNRLTTQRSEFANRKTQWAGKAEAAREQASTYAAQQKTKTKQATETQQQLSQNRQKLLQTESVFKEHAAATDAARSAREALVNWNQSLAERVKQNAELLVGMRRAWEKIAAWRPELLRQAQEEERRLESAVKECAGQLARAEQSKATLAAQLEQIQGGVCPFLKEQCRQFEPAKVLSNLREKETEIQKVTETWKDTAAAHEKARAACDSLAREEAGLRQSREGLREKVEAFVQCHNELVPAGAQKSLHTLEEYLTGEPGNGGVHLVAPAGAGECWSPSGQLELGILESMAGAQMEMLKQVTQTLASSAPEFELKLRQFEEQRTERLAREQGLRHYQQVLQGLESEVKDFSARLEQQELAAKQAEGEAVKADEAIARINAQLQPFANVEQERAAAQALKDQAAEGHKTHLESRVLAEQLPARRSELEKSVDQEKQAHERCCQQETSCHTASRNFDPAALQTARNMAAEARIRLALEQRNLVHAEEELKRQQQRASEWQEASRERGRLEREIGRLKAAAALAKLAGNVLKAAAPAVAQQLCTRIAANAQRIVNRLNNEPLELEWRAEPQYSLRITPGERRFAMLSGGEQTKLALAMTLAMLQQFSTLRFAVFDEPTYGVDGESRQKLADAILEAQPAAGLEQLILVSHDNAFEGKIENMIVLNKNIESGTTLALQA